MIFVLELVNECLALNFSCCCCVLFCHKYERAPWILINQRFYITQLVFDILIIILCSYLLPRIMVLLPQRVSLYPLLVAFFCLLLLLLLLADAQRTDPSEGV